MCSIIGSLNPLAVIVVSIVGFAIGGIWYSGLFGRAWMAEMKFTEESMKEGGGAIKMVWAFLFTVVSTVALAVLASALGLHGALVGAKLGLAAGVGLVAAREATNAVFQKQSLKLFCIVTGHDVVMLTATGAILGVWR